MINALLETLEIAPNRETAEALLLQATLAGARPERLRTSWLRWRRNHGQAVLDRRVA